jgi:hypothetical protein
MLLTIFFILLTINIVGFLNRKRAWAKIFLVSQVFVVGGLVVMFNIYSDQSGIEGLEAKQKKIQIDQPTKLDDLQDLANDKNKKLDTLDYEKETQNSNQVKFK